MRLAISASALLGLVACAGTCAPAPGPLADVGMRPAVITASVAPARGRYHLAPSPDQEARWRTLAAHARVEVLAPEAWEGLAPEDATVLTLARALRRAAPGDPRLGWLARALERPKALTLTLTSTSARLSMGDEFLDLPREPGPGLVLETPAHRRLPLDWVTVDGAPALKLPGTAALLRLGR